MTRSRPPPVDLVERITQLLRCRIALHRRRHNDEPHLCATPANDRDDVVQRRAVGTRDDGDDARESGRAPLSLRSEQAVGGETRARDLERFATKAVALASMRTTVNCISPRAG
jgi:hypothetical protein